MYAKLENPLSAWNVVLGLLLAASLILPTLARADGIVVRPAPLLHFIMLGQPAKSNSALDAFPAS